MNLDRDAREGVKPSTLFCTLIAVQALHSLEEYVFRLYDVFPPARFASGLVSSNLPLGFLILNAAIITFGVWCCFGPVRRRSASAVPLMWLWVAIETANGIVHPTWSVIQGGYTPGVATALLLLPVALILGRRLAA